MNVKKTRKNFTIIYSNYLKDIRKDLLEESELNINKNDNEIIYIIAEIEGISVPIMIDTGANVSIINRNELDRIQQECHKNLPVLPINNIVLVGATGRQNKTIRKQVSLNVKSQGISVDMIFLVAAGLPFNIMIGCDILRRNSAIIDLCRGKVSLFAEGSTWIANLTDNKTLDSRQLLDHQNKVNYLSDHSTNNKPVHQDSEEDLWQQKIQEIRNFQCHNTTEQLEETQLNQLVNIYEKYRAVFSLSLIHI